MANTKTPWKLRKVVKIVCAHCGVQKGDMTEQCKGCGSYVSKPIVREVTLGKRQPFAQENREANPL